jgi:hypothetical protein
LDSSSISKIRAGPVRSDAPRRGTSNGAGTVPPRFMAGSENFCRSEDFPRRGKSSGATRDKARQDPRKALILFAKVA